MNEETRKRYQLLRARSKKKIEQLYWQNDVMFQECIEALKLYKVLTLEDTELIFRQMASNFPMTDYGCICWKKIDSKIVIEKISDIFNICCGQQEFYILWDNWGLPGVRCKLETIIENIDDVLAVAFDTWLLSSDKKEVIEFYHEGSIVYGKIK